jgi:Tfp pilus assembly protein PilO
MITSIAKRNILLRSSYFVFSLVVFSVMIFMLHSYRQAYSEVQSVYAEQQAQQQMATIIENTLSQSEDERKQLQSFFLSERDTISFITAVEQLARNSQVTLETTQLSVVPATETDPSKLNVGFSYEGSYNRVINLTAQIETLPYHITVTRVTLVKLAQGQWRGDVTLTVTLQ